MREQAHQIYAKVAYPFCLHLNRSRLAAKWFRQMRASQSHLQPPPALLHHHTNSTGTRLLSAARVRLLSWPESLDRNLLTRTASLGLSRSWPPWPAERFTARYLVDTTPIKTASVCRLATYPLLLAANVSLIQNKQENEPLSRPRLFWP
jgi:hypothetical protein